MVPDKNTKNTAFESGISIDTSLEKKKMRQLFSILKSLFELNLPEIA